MKLVVDYDARWPELFERERAALGEALGEAVVAIEHVGSTSVPGLAAKPIVDIAVAVDSSSFAWRGSSPATAIATRRRRAPSSRGC